METIGGVMRLPDCPAVVGEAAVNETCADLLKDESNLSGKGLEAVFFPETSEQAAAVLRAAHDGVAGVVLSGARTGIVGGAVPDGVKWALSTARLNAFLGPGLEPHEVKVQAGLTLAEMSARVDTAFPPPGGWFYPVDPTESSASVGGTIATDASGARSYRYGSTREWVRSLTVATADGSVVTLRRGEVCARDGILRYEPLFGARELMLPDLSRPASKCAAGYYLKPDVDLVDLFIGSEGTLGLVLEAELALARAPAEMMGVMCFLPDGADGLGLVRAVKESGLEPLAIEYFDLSALDLLREERERGADAIPELPKMAASAVFVELAYDAEDDFLSAVDALDSLLSAAGGSMDETWVGDPRLKVLRHGVPEAVNSLIARRKRDTPCLHKVGTDLAVPDASAEEMYAIYRRELADLGLEHAVFGHAGENHLHVNFLPRNLDELARAKSAHLTLAREAVRLGGAVTAEHGIGRLKRELLTIQYGEEGVAEMRRVKAFCDPRCVLNPGVLFGE